MTRREKENYNLRSRNIVLLFAICVSFSEAVAQDIVVGGQVRPRFEYRSPYLTSASGGDWLIAMRARGQITASLEKTSLSLSNSRMYVCGVRKEIHLVTSVPITSIYIRRTLM